MGSLIWTTLLTFFIFAAIGGWIAFLHWRASTLTRLRNGAQIVETSRGPIECAVVSEGPAILISHGVMGGYDQGLACVASGFFGDRLYRFIALSRPGYLRTPLEIGKTPEQQADAFAALLDALKIEKAVIVGISGGGPPSLQFALRHPDRCTALLLISAVTERLPRTEQGKLAVLLRALVLADFPAWLMLGLARKFPNLGFHSILSPDELQHIREPGLLANLLRIMDSTVPISVRRLGLMSDGDYLLNLPTYPLASIHVPTLVIHGTRDTIVPFAASERTAVAIPGARLIPINNGSHFAGLLGRGVLGTEVNKFLDDAVRRSGRIC